MKIFILLLSLLCVTTNVFAFGNETFVGGVAFDGKLKESVVNEGQQDYLRGDANEDGVVNVADIQAIASYILALSDQINFENSDVNDDESVDIHDIILIIIGIYPHAGYEYVDLGLPSGLKWATCNVGAVVPEARGDYFAWGETVPKSVYTEDNYTAGEVMADISGDSDYDAAAANWGEDWRMPTEAEFQELVTVCTWEWTTQNDVNGYKVTGTNGNHIFLPASGYFGSSSLYDGVNGYYWSSTPFDGSNGTDANSLYFGSDNYLVYNGNRCHGRNVRPITGIALSMVMTGEVVNITSSTAECGGNVTYTGGSEVTAYGVCWSTTQNPTIEDSHTVDGSGTGEFTSSITGLAQNTTYYVRAYSTNGGGTSYGESMTFTTMKEIKLPTVTTGAVSDITETTAVSGGNVIGDGGAEVTECGVCYSTTQNPTIADSHTTDGGGVGSFTSGLTGLMSNTTYYIRAYATNSAGTNYGEESSFTTIAFEYVDLGLPSGIKWSPINVGAVTPEEYGDYFAWGETSTKETYTEDNSITYGEPFEDISGDQQYDAAASNWGDSWRMPIVLEIQELIDECTWEWTTQNGVAGHKVTGPNGNYIFLPAAGYRSGTSLHNANTDGYFWSSTPIDGSSGIDANCLYFDSDDHIVYNSNRFHGRNVRPVTGVALPIVTTGEVVNITSSTAECSGIVIYTGGSKDTEHGVCWSTSPNPTIEDNHTMDGNGAGEFTSNMTGLMQYTTYYVRAYATNSAGTCYGEEVVFKTEREYVDLGLPSGLKWAGYNVGASSAEQYGDYFAWAEIATKDEYEPETYVPWGINENICGNPQYDAATANWGANWRMPTEAEIQELMDECEWEWITHNGVSGRKVTGSNGNSIFLPAAGYRTDGLYYEGENGWYWSSIPSNATVYAYSLSFGNSSQNTVSSRGDRGFCVRPVTGIFLPLSTVNEITDITTISAKCNCNVVDDRGAEVTERGLCWSTSPNPTKEDSHIVEGTGEGEFTTILTGLVHNTKYYVRAYAVNSVGIKYSEEMSFTTNEYECVDLGLSSGLKWATCNVGAAYPVDYGDYFAWGETSPKETYTKDNNLIYEQQIEDISGNPDYDAATANWHGDWRMPTKAEFQELVTECSWEWTTENGVAGRKVTGPNGNYIFFPAAGYHNEELVGAGEQGRFWGATPCDNNVYYANGLYISSGEYKVDSTYYYRYCGYSVRPIRGTALPTVVTEDVVNVTLSEAECVYSVSNVGKAPITSRGVCWSESPNPTIADSHTTDGSGTGEFTSSITGLKYSTIYYVRAYATNSEGTSYGEEMFFVTDCYEYVDLGLPSGLKWAVHDVGAASPGEYGDYFAWGETSPKETYTQKNSKTYEEKFEDFSGNPEYDAATANWGELWRMPTREEMEELVSECPTNEWTTENGVVGMKVTGTNDNCIFFPAAGVRTEDRLIWEGEWAHIFSSTPDCTSAWGGCSFYYAYDLSCSDHSIEVAARRYRGYGLNVRPVTEVALPIVTTSEVVNVTSTTAECGGNVTIVDGGEEVLLKGLCWSTSPNPTVNDNNTANGSGTGEFTNVISRLKPATTYYIRAFAVNVLGVSYGKEFSFTTEFPYVDLGLPSGLKWAMCNLGAASLEDYGDYYAWGEIEPKDEYNSETYKPTEVCENISGNPQYDAATANLGADWRMPTDAEIQELIDECTWEWITQNGVSGRKGTGPNGNSIFLPAAGYNYGLSSGLESDGKKGMYWSSMPTGYSNAYILSFDNSSQTKSTFRRYLGLCVRPVRNNVQE